METHKPLLKGADDIMFAVCACARFQVNPKSSHLHAVKRIFRYLKGQPKLGLWYPKDSPFDLVAYTDSDYAGASLDRKSTTGGALDSKSIAGLWFCWWGLGDFTGGLGAWRGGFSGSDDGGERVVLMLLGINLLLLLKVNAARHNLQLLVNVNAVEGSFINT
ncbi:hypothetical protein Tco_0047824 [Tanacetum coccineum]